MENPGSYNDMKAKHPEATHEEIIRLHSAVVTEYREEWKKYGTHDMAAIALRQTEDAALKGIE